MADSTPTTLTVTEFTERVKTLLEGTFHSVWVEGEISQLKVHRSGHVYLTLKDEDARLEAVVWRSTAWKMQYQPGVGERVVARGRVSLYPQRGSYQLVIQGLQPAGIGALQAAYEALKAKLGAEGLFDDERKRPLPFLPRAVGVVTSATGAARRDIEAVVHRRCPQVPIILYPATVQGPGAAAEIVRGIEALAKRPDVDVIIAGRGGGSIEDLWAFNEEPVVRAIATCSKPIISAVGHETDFTLADFVADWRSPTPSAAAERAVPVRDDLLYTIDLNVERMTQAVRRTLERGRHRLTQAGQRLVTGVNLARGRRRLQGLSGRLDMAFQRHAVTAKTRLHVVEQRLATVHPAARLARSRQRLQAAVGRLAGVGPRAVSRARADFRETAARLAALSPLASLDRGYGIARSGGQIVRSHQDVTVGEPVEVLVHDGWFRAEVTDAGPGLPDTSNQKEKS